MIFGVDINNARIKLMRIQSPSEKIVMEYLPFDEDLALRGNIAAMFESALSLYVKEKGEFKSTSVNLVLPNTAVAIDAITLPSMKRARLSEVFATEFKTLYKNSSSLQTKSLIIKTSKMATTYLVTMVQKKLISEIDDVLDKYNLNLKVTTYVAATTAEAIYALGPKIGRRNTMIVDIKENETEIVLYGKDIIYGFSTLPFGYSSLQNDTIVNESMVFFEEAAELAVINAKESAKSKSLTMAIDIEDEEDEAPKIVNKVVSKDAVKSEEVVGEQTELGRDDFVRLMREVTEEEPDETIDEDQEVVKEVPLQKTLTRKIKKYPKFMHRDEPTTEEGYIIENFRLFQKRILLYAKHCETSDYLPEVDFVMVHVPDQFMFLNEKIENENPKDIEMKFFSSITINNKIVAENLDLYGSRLGRSTSKNSTF